MKMTNKEILYNAIIKAEDNGYKGHLKFLPVITGGSLDNYDKFCMTVFHGHQLEIIYSVDFAKAFWGEDRLCYICKKSNTEGHSIYCSKRAYSDVDLISWEYHLSKMVLEKEPLKYMEKFL